MKRCPRCNRIYPEDDLNFCLDDGELLQVYSDEQPTRPLNQGEPPPTVVLDPTRVTNPIGWDAGQNIGGPVGQWQGNQPQYQQPLTFGYSAAPSFGRSLDQSLPTIALILAGLSIVTICCYGGFYFGIPAAVLGFIGMRNADRDPSRYGGRGMAIAAAIIGAITCILGILFIFTAVLSNLSFGLNLPILYN